ncbi:Golgi apparatus protein 1 [Bombyx mandarina]|uniref:Golgi apparatus protein 1 n=1 Tax=Bombyx mandarina TaxID=7092 RepID=A0A6J2JWU5_BOMMA|nr:Golgi apparatus protein 1 [Bombyx mandarina]
MSTKVFTTVWVITACLGVLKNVHCRKSDDNSYKNYLFSWDAGECALYHKLCSHLDDHFALLTCSLHSSYDKTQIPPSCQHKLWVQLSYLINNSFLFHTLKDPCQEDTEISSCFDPNVLTVDCILKKKPSATVKVCWRMINKIESLLFNDWQITTNFISKCFDDVNTHTCGKIPPDPKSLSQTETLKCLQNYEQYVTADCKAEITVLYEMRYSNLQLDKIVFAACNVEQNSFCRDEIPGSWLMYKCLLRHKYENGVRKKCQDQLFYDQKNIAMNYKMSRGLVKACREDIRKFHCRKGIVEDKDVRLAQILLCLESNIQNDTKSISSECTAEMIDHRKMLMEDYRLSPELMQNCANDITMLCRGIEAGGKTIHCLMDHARPRRRKDRRISLECQKSLEMLVQETNPGEDWRVDPVLRAACKPVVDKACGEIAGGNGRVMSCLMEKIHTKAMTDECEVALLQIQYFISRDFKLDPQLYKACKYDAVTTCKAKLQWADASEHHSEKDPLIFPCLYNYAYNSELRGRLRLACEEQVKRVMRQRASSVDLMPQIEDFCMDDLANFCLENTGKGEEILCLQSKIKELSPKCKDIVSNFTETQSGHIELNAVINTNCRGITEKLCASELQSKKEEDDVLECLILHKNHPDVKANVKCRAAIEHEQLISLKNYRFTTKFKNACKYNVDRFCPKAQTKNQVVSCLSEIVRNDTINRRKHTIVKECRQQLRSQLFQQKENIDLDPDLKEACKKDLEILCPSITHGEAAALECLQTSKGKLSQKCRKVLFVVKKQEFTDSGIDYHLIKTCNDMIDKFCHNTEPSKIFDCLKTHHQSLDFEKNCKVVVVNRMIEQNTDYRFNINLVNSCKSDINAHCSEILANEPQDVELQGKVLYCLKEKFRESKLTTDCENEVANILKEQALNYRLDPLLEKLCQAEIQTICSVQNDITISDGQVEECLKNALLKDKIVSAECSREIAKLIEQTEVDIEADPLLERACAFDLLKYCKDLEHGAGRRLKCLKIISNDGTRKLEAACEKELTSRLEMYRFVAAKFETLGDVYHSISSSPSKKYFLVVGISIVGIIFIFGLYCGHVTKKAMYVKQK